MKTESLVRILAGTLVLVGLVLAYFVHPLWLGLTAFVGVNLFQSGFTGFCPAEILIRKLGFGGGASAVEVPSPPRV